MEKPVTQLEIPPQWMLWRVYHVDDVPWDWWIHDAEEDEESKITDEGRDLQALWVSGRYVRDGDPMDEEDFDEAASFPAFKPDRDLFGPPRRCRKQRGWYYVKRWSPATRAIEFPPQEEYATGADVPPELLNNIVKCFWKDRGNDRQLGALRLVCRHWERLCTQVFFLLQTLRTHEDVMDRLAGLEKRRGWGWQAYPILNLHLHLDVIHNSRGLIATVQMKLLPKLDVPTFMRLTIRGPLPAGRRLTSIYLSSPCRSPWRPLRIQNLTLHDLHFRNLDDLVRVLRELPFLWSVGGSGITWDSGPDVYPRATSFIPGQGSSHRTEYDFEDRPHLNAMLACVLSPSGTPRIAQPDANLLCAVASAFTHAPCSRSTRSYEIITMCESAPRLWYSGLTSC